MASTVKLGNGKEFVSKADYDKLVAECAELKLHNQITVELWDGGADLDNHLMKVVKTPVADATIAELKSDARKEGIIFATNKILAAWESGFIDDTPAQAFDISGAVLSTLEFLPNASDEEFKRDYADEVRAAIAANLRSGRG